MTTCNGRNCGQAIQPAATSRPTGRPAARSRPSRATPRKQLPRMPWQLRVPDSRPEAENSAQGSSETSPGQNQSGDGDGGNGNPAPTDKTGTHGQKDPQNQGDGTAVTAEPAAVMFVQVQATPDLAASQQTVANAGTQVETAAAIGNVQNGIPAPKSADQGNTQVATALPQAIGSEPLPAGSATTTTDSPSTEKTLSTTLTTSDIQPAAVQGSEGSPSLPIAAAGPTGAAPPTDAAPQPANPTPTELGRANAGQVNVGQAAAADSSWQNPQSNEEWSTSLERLSQPDAASLAGATAAVHATAATAAVAQNLSPEKTSSPAEKTSGGDGKEAAGSAASSPAAGPISAAAHLSGNQESRAAEAATTSKPGDIGQADRTRFVQRVEQAFQSMSASGGTIRLRLSPPELGSMRLEITVRNGNMTARAETETSAARNMLLDNLPASRDRLAQQDIKVQHFNVDVMDQSPGGTPGQTSYSSDTNTPRGNNHSNGAVVADAGDGATRFRTWRRGAGGAGNQLNVII